MIDIQEHQMMFTIFLKGEMLCGFACQHMAKKMVATLVQARESGPRRAMQLLTGELGMCDAYAAHIFELLTDASPSLN